MSLKQTPKSFWARVDKRSRNECWNWQGSCNSTGYGTVAWHGVVVQAHRVAWFLTHGGVALQTKFRQSGRAKRYRRFVLHQCDNRKCCNPAHLFLGSMRANQLDAYAKGRKVQPQGANHANAKLSKVQATTIRKVYNAGGTRQIDLAVLYGVSQKVISLIVRGETYR